MSIVGMTDTILRILEGCHECTEYEAIYERVKVELDAILSTGQTHYVNVIEMQNHLHSVRSTLISNSALKIITEILEIIGTMKSDELHHLRGLLL